MYIDNLESIGNVKPLVICGNARSGTRMMTDIVNSHPNIVVQEEMHAKTIEAYFRLTEEVDDTFAHYSKRKGTYLANHWDSKKKSLTLAFLSFANKKSMVGLGKDVKYYGIKTPGFERYFKSFESVFAKEATYIYCLRNPVSVWRSWKSLEFVDDVELFKSRYIRSLRQAIKIKNNAKGRFILFQLDDFIASNNQSSYISENIFKNLELDKGLLPISIEEIENRNSLEKRGAKSKEGDNFLREKKILENDETLKMYMEKLISHD